MAAPRPLRRPLALLLAATLVGGGVVAGLTAPAAADRPTAVVALGDSFISGEAAGAYEPGTDRAGNFCHRSTVSEIARTAIPGIEARVNLACSGATTNNIALGGDYRYGEAPQAERLRAVARDNDVKMVVLTIGANNVGFANMVFDCIGAYFLVAPRCQDVWATRFGERLGAAAPAIAQNLADIRTVMREAGYADDSYQLVLQSYSSPVTEDDRYPFTKAFEGCPVRDDDARWARDSVVPQFTATMGAVAAQAGVRFLDMGPALRGREVCARGINHSQEWTRGITIDVSQVLNGLGLNIVQQTLHPNARGHAAFGQCLTTFYALPGTAARCVRSGDALTAVPASLPALSRDTAPRTFPRTREAAPSRG